MLHPITVTGLGPVNYQHETIYLFTKIEPSDCFISLNVLLNAQKRPHLWRQTANVKLPFAVCGWEKKTVAKLRTLSSLIDTGFDNFKKLFTEGNSSSVEAAVKRAKRARFVFQSKGNEQQFEHAESVLDKLESAKEALNANATSKAKTDIE